MARRDEARKSNSQNMLPSCPIAAGGADLYDAGAKHVET